MTVHEVDVLIAGAGPCGLTAALAIRKAAPHLTVQVLERAKEMKPCGGSIGIAFDNVWKAFDAIGENVTKAVRDASLQRTSFTTADMDGSNRNTKDLPTQVVSWHDLQQALLSQLPDGTVLLNSAVKEVRLDHTCRPGAVRYWPASGT
jgi:2-polyprenyl-6-methoxyphenol hydroxylase-like FAD-dependent oxidoreductase